MRNIRNQVIQEGVDTTYKNVDSQPDVLRDEKENFSKSVPTVQKQNIGKHDQSIKVTEQSNDLDYYISKYGQDYAKNLDLQKSEREKQKSERSRISPQISQRSRSYGKSDRDKSAGVSERSQPLRSNRNN